MDLDLLSNMNRVEVPFISVEMAGETFGVYSKTKRQGVTEVKYPDFIDSLTVTKINGLVNTYNLHLIYALDKDRDPNFFDKIFSKVKLGGSIWLTYGDISMPTYVYKREEAILVDVKTSVDFAGAKITYNISCQSKSMLGKSNKFNFPYHKSAKPSDLIKEILYSNFYGLQEIFYGMKDRALVESNHLIDSDDASVEIPAQNNISPLDYLQYLVTNMIPYNYTGDKLLQSGTYRICAIDDTSGIFEGPYFKVKKISSNIDKDTLNVYTINIGYPDKNMVIDFSLDDSQTPSLFYNYSESTEQPKYIERIDDDGRLVYEYSPALTNSSTYLKTTSADMAWWNNMISFPVTGTLTIKGLIKPSILMSYIYIDAKFFGRDHVSTGYYAIQKQVDSISSQGYRTTLSLMRIPVSEVK